MRTFYLDYRSANGVLFSFLQKANGTTPFNGNESSYTNSVDFNQMEINPTLDKRKFEINN